MMLFQREINTNNGWEFVGAGNDLPRTLLDCTKEYRYFFIHTDL